MNYRVPILNIRDRHTGQVHRYGSDVHDSLCLDHNGNIQYLNLQNGDGTGGKSAWYEFVYEPDEGGYNGFKEISLTEDA